MSLTSLTLRNFRSYDEASFEFSPGVNIILGPNAVGKTNLLEAVHVACLGNGFRSKRDSELIKSGQEWSRLEANIGGKDRTVVLKKAVDSRLQKQFIFGGNKRSRLAFDDLQPLVLFQPDDLRLVFGSPSRRRDYFDSLLSLLIPSYRQDVLTYDRVLLQRNSFLKNSSFHGNTDQLFVWNMQLAERGGRIIKRRLSIVEKLNEEISAVYSRVAGNNHTVELHYDSDVVGHSSDSLLRALEKNAHTDILRGFTGVGPHRDDVRFTLDGKSFKAIASRGENRTMVLALKIIQLEEIEHRREIPPILLLDDVFSELDGARRRLLTDYLKSHQTLITTTDADVVGKKFTQTAGMISLPS